MKTKTAVKHNLKPEYADNVLATYRNEIKELKEINTELLEALRLAVHILESDYKSNLTEGLKATIAKAEGGR